MSMFSMDNKEIKQFEDDLKTFKAKALPFATKNTLNRAAVLTQEKTRTRIRNKMINRNKFTERSIQIEFVKTLKISDQEAVVGSTAPYMEDQEFGGVKNKTGKHGVAIPTTVASGEGKGKQPRRKPVRPRNKLAKIKFSKASAKRFKSRRQEVFVKTLLAARSGHKELFLDTGRTQAIYRIKGRGRINSKGQLTGIKMNMLYDLSRSTVPIPKKPTLGPSTTAVQKQIPFIYKKKLEEQLRRHGLFKG